MISDEQIANWEVAMILEFVSIVLVALSLNRKCLEVAGT